MSRLECRLRNLGDTAVDHMTDVETELRSVNNRISAVEGNLRSVSNQVNATATRQAVLAEIVVPRRSTPY